MHHQSAFEQRARQAVEQRRTVARIDFDDGEFIRRLVVEQDARGDVEGARAAMRQRTLREARGKIDPVRQRIGNAFLQPVELARFGEGFAMRVLDRKLSSAQPMRVVWMRASMMFPPARWMPPAMR